MNHEKCAKFPKCATCAKSAQRFFFEPFGGKSDAADSFSILPWSISMILMKKLKCHKIESRLMRSKAPDLRNTAPTAVESEIIENDAF